jgi:hypothetical protein
MARPGILAAVLGVLLALPGPAPVHAQQAPGGSQVSDVEILVLSPDPGARVEPGAVLVAVSFVEPDRLDPGSLVLEVDGRNVTSQANVGTYTLRWRPPAPLSPGPHRVRLTGTDRSGLPLPPLEWTFTVTSPDAPTVRAPGDPRPALFDQPWAPAGTVVFESAGQSASGPGADFRRDESFVPRLWVNAGGTIAPGWRYSTRIHVSGYESSNRQPVNRFRFDVRSNRLNVALGDVNPNFQDVMLAGRRVRGFQGDVRAGPVQVALVTGSTRRAIDGIIDPADPFQLVRTGTFGQNLFALRPSVGRGERFQVGMTVLRVRDDVNSLDLDLRTDPDPSSGATQAASPLPRDNLVAGTDFTFRMMDGRVLVQYENGISFYANDISDGPLTQAALDSIMEASGFRPMEIDPSRWERLFIMNASMIPLDPRGLTNVAHQLRSSVRAGAHMISFEYRHIGGSYFTLGYPSLQRDQAGFRIRDSFTLMGNALALSAGVERFQDNLDEIKPATTTSTGLFADASWQPSRDRIGLTGSFRVGSRSNGLASGADGAMDESNWAVSAGITYPFLEAPLGFLERYRTEALLNVSLINRDDPDNPMVGSKNLFLMGGLRGETGDRASEFSVLYGINRSELTGFDDASSTFHRAMANLKRPIRPRWAGTLDGTLTLARSPESAEVMGVDYSRFEVMAGGQWEWEATSLVSFGLGFSSYSDSRFDNRDIREILTRIRVSRAF